MQIFDVLSFPERRRSLKMTKESKTKSALGEQLLSFLIHVALPQSRPVVIIIFTRGVRTSVCPHFSKSRKTKQIFN